MPIHKDRRQSSKSHHRKHIDLHEGVSQTYDTPSLAKFLLHIKARTSLGREFIMSMNLSLGIFLLQLLNQRFQCRLLLGGIIGHEGFQ